MLDSIKGTIAQSQSNLAALKASQATKHVNGKDMSAQKAKDAAQDFEAVYISQMLTHMFEGIPTDGPFGGGNAEKIYRSMMVDEYGKLLAQNGGIGLSDAIHHEILELQSKQTLAK